MRYTSLARFINRFSSLQLNSMNDYCTKIRCLLIPAVSHCISCKHIFETVDCFPGIGQHSEPFTQYKREHLCGERNLVVADWLGAE